MGSLPSHPYDCLDYESNDNLFQIKTNTKKVNSHNIFSSAQAPDNQLRDAFKKKKETLGHWPKRGEGVKAKSQMLVSTEFGTSR